MLAAPWFRRTVLAAGIASGLAFLLAYLTWPYGWDQGIYAVAANVLRAGGQPYVDAWDMKGPAVPYLTALGQALTGPTPLGLRLFDLVFLGSTLVILTVLARRAASRPRDALVPALVLTLWYLSLSYWHTAQPDGWVAAFVAVAVLLTLAPGRFRGAGAVVAGAMIGIAFLVKQPYALFGLPIMAATLGRQGETLKSRAGEAALAILGSAAVVVSAMLYFRKIGMLPALWDSHYQYAIEYSGALGPRLRGAVEGFLNLVTKIEVVPALIPFAALGWHDLRSKDPVAARTYVSWALAAVVVILLQNRFYDYHLLLLAPPLALLGGLGVVRFINDVRDRARTPVVASGSILGFALVGLLVLHTVPFIGVETGRWLKWVVGLSSRQEYLDGFGAPGAEYRTALFLRSASTADDEILMWGTNTGVLALADRRSFTRFTYNLGLLSHPTPTVERYDAEFRQRFDAKRPRFIVVGEPHGDVEKAERRPLDLWVRAIIASEYALRLDAGRLKTYERLDAQVDLPKTEPRPR